MMLALGMQARSGEPSKEHPKHAPVVFPSMAAAVIQKVNAFLEGDDNSEYFCYQEDHDHPKPTDKELLLSVNGRFNFSLLLPDLRLHSEEEALSQWVAAANEFGERERDVTTLLRHATQAFAAAGLGDEDDGMEEFDDDGDAFVPVADQPRPSHTDCDQEAEFQAFRQSYEKRGLVTNPQAASRIFADLRQLWTVGKEAGFSAEPLKDNLFRWTITFFNFEKDTPLHKDVLEYKRRTGRDTLEFVMDFPQEYPFRPPFIRALRPRFAFHTGHITVGGSVCMELLTNSGWSAANSVESILVQIRAEITAGGGRLDFGNAADYTEAEARAAFHRVARDHGWEKNG